MSQDFAYDPTMAFLDEAEAAVTEFADDMERMPLIVDGIPWWGPWTRTRAGAKLITKFPFPLQSPDLRDWKGSTEYDRLGRLFTKVRRKKQFIGVMEEADKIAEADFEGFAISPETMNRIIVKAPGVKLGRLISRAHAIKDWTGTNFFETTAIKPVMPGKKKAGAPWLNAYENSALTIPNIKRSLRNLQDRRGFDGKVLKLNGTHLWLPTSKLEDGRDLVETFQLIPYTLDGVSGGGNTNPARGRLKAWWVPDMRSDMWIVANEPPDPMLAPFAYVQGGSGDYAEANENLKSGNVPPYLEPVLKLRDDPLYKDKGMLACGYIVREGVGLLTPHCLIANYTGNKTDAYTI